jgi:hypothetical protein
LISSDHPAPLYQMGTTDYRLSPTPLQHTRELAGPSAFHTPLISRYPELPSPTPQPLNFKKRASELSAVSTIPLEIPDPPNDLPFNYISLPSPQSPDDEITRSASTTTTYSIPIGLGINYSRSRKGRGKTVAVGGQEVRLTHNHSREWRESDREHVMSWATYQGPDASPLDEEGTGEYEDENTH